MCGMAVFLRVKEELDIFDKNGIDLLHIDIMDGSFVPNIALGTCFTTQLRGESKIPLDIHLMIDSPERYLHYFSIKEGDYVSIHYESTKHVQRAIQMSKDMGARVLLALNPATPVEAAREVLEDIDGVLIMSVNPGYAGQKMIPNSIDKIKRMRSFLDENGKSDAEIEVDGNVSIQNAIKMKEAGANIFVLGTAIQSKKGFSKSDFIRFKREVF